MRMMDKQGTSKPCSSGAVPAKCLNRCARFCAHRSRRTLQNYAPRWTPKSGH